MDNIWFLCPTYNNQTAWLDLGIQPKDMKHLSLNPMTYNKLLVFDGLQGDLKNNKIFEEVFTKGRHHRVVIIQCQQFTQDTAHIEEANTKYFALCPSFSIFSCEYFHRKFSATLEPEAIKNKVIMLKKSVGHRRAMNRAQIK